MSLSIIIALILLGGWLFSFLFNKIKLPGIVGMLFWGILLSYLVTFTSYNFDQISNVEPLLKNLALIVILLRAGLGLHKSLLRKSGKTVILMSFVPCILEGTALTFFIHKIFGFELYTAGLTAFMLSAVSPAVIVPSMLDLKEKKIGTLKDVPSIILAGASVDDVFAITIFSIFLGLSTSGNVNIWKSVLSIPVSLLLGVIPGIIIGFLFIRFLNHDNSRVKTTEKLLIIITGSMFLVQIGDILHSAALLGVMAIGIIMLNKAETVANNFAGKLKKIWIFAEIILFVLIGLSVDINIVFKAGAKGVLIVFTGLVFRSAGVILSTIKSGLNFRERLFCIIAYLPKATVQAALGSVALHHGIAGGETILALAVLSILLTAPIGLLGIKLFGKKLLSDL